MFYYWLSALMSACDYDGDVNVSSDYNDLTWEVHRVSDWNFPKYDIWLG